MKKLIALSSVLFFMVLAQTCFAQNIVIEGIYDKYQVVYSPKTKKFSTGGTTKDRIVLTKHTSVGSGSYSYYFYSDGRNALGLDSNFEFIKDGRLIACDNADLKYYEVFYKNKQFRAKKLSYKQVKKLFPTAQVIKVSDFKNQMIILDSSPKLVLIYNDTNEYFYKFSFEPSSVKISDIAGLINIENAQIIKFSHYGEKDFYKQYQLIAN